MTVKKERKKGGAVRPWASTLENPISARIVGRKTGSDENATFPEKYIT
jgi:hypothetical protein